MKKRDFLFVLENTLEMDEGSLTGNESLDSLDGWDSLAAVIFIGEIDSHFGVVIEPNQIDSASSVADLIALVADKLED